ncbi:MAG: peptide ABC transporter substrate-binding protein [Anaerolineae bacterium]
MGRHIRWPAILTFTGIAMTMAFLIFLAFSRTTVTLPDVGGTYIEGIAGIPQFINPLLAQYNQVDQDLTALIFNGLTRFNGQGELEPDLARNWIVSDDGLVYVFKLRNNIRWQDNRPLTADDVIFTIGLMQNPDFPGVPGLARLWQTVTVEKVDNTTIRFTLPEPYPAFADFTTIGILPQHLLKDMPARDMLNHPFNLKPVGSGPFKLDEVNAEFARLSTNPLYSGAKPRLAHMELRFYPSYQETITAYQAGAVLGVSSVPPQAIPQVKTLDSLNLYTARLAAQEIIYLNLQDLTESPFFQEVKVRQALLHALDRQAIIDQALNGQGLIANGPIRSWSWAYDAGQPVSSFDPGKAAALLDEAGWKDSDGDGVRDKEGRPFTFRLLTSDEPDRVKVAELASQQWQKVGIAATLETIGAGLGDRLAKHQFQAALAEVVLTGDPDPYPFWHQTQIAGGQNYAGWSNDDASMLLEQARTLTDKGKRNDYYFQFQRIFADQAPSLVLFHPVYTYGVSHEVYDVQLGPMSNPSDRFRTIANWYLLTRQVIDSGLPPQSEARP